MVNLNIMLKKLVNLNIMLKKWLIWIYNDNKKLPNSYLMLKKTC